jgi:hypothetical protein
MGAVAMPAADLEDLIAHLSGGLHPDDRDAFRQAAVYAFKRGISRIALPCAIAPIASSDRPSCRSLSI